MRLRPRWTPLTAFLLSFVLLIAAAGALWVAQFRDNHAAPWVSMVLSAIAVECTAVSIAMGRRRSERASVPADA